jgi:hypothetical protein
MQIQLWTPILLTPDYALTVYIVCVQLGALILPDSIAHGPHRAHFQNTICVVNCLLSSPTHTRMWPQLTVCTGHCDRNGLAYTKPHACRAKAAAAVFVT